MSPIALRRALRRRGRRCIALAAVTVLGTLVLAHHGPASEHHATSGAAGMAMHQAHDVVPGPVDEIGLAGICAAVLPGFLLLALVLGPVVLGRRRIQALRRRREVLIGSCALDRRARAGPRVLCVMRC